MTASAFVDKRCTSWLMARKTLLPVLSLNVASCSASVAFGLSRTGGIITGAALIMVAVFGGVALGNLAMMQQLGFGLAVAVLLDATVVRCLLVPGVMKLLGDANWYLPRWLSWLPHDLGWRIAAVNGGCAMCRRS